MLFSRATIPLWQRLSAIRNSLLGRSDVKTLMSDTLPIDSLPDMLNDLFKSSGSRCDLWAKFVNRIQAITLLEIGVWRGAFA